MIKYYFIFFLAFISLFFFGGCVGSKVGMASKGEQLTMSISEKKDVINFSNLKDQQIQSLASRGNTAARGLPIAPLVGNVLSLATNAIKNVIANEKEKYTAAYEFALTDLYFYDQLSNENPFDPAGMQFNGFKIVRTFVNNKGETDTAFTASFSLDKTNNYEMLNNSIFRLRLDDFKLKYAKAKLDAAAKKMLNMDIEIAFQSSFLNQDAVLFDNVTLGKFYLFLRNAPLDTAAENYNTYYNNLKGNLLTGKSFIVPRSFGYHMENGEPKPGFSQGAYTIAVKVKESSKDNFIKKLITESSTIIIDNYKEKSLNYLNNKLPANLQ
jgi:hypothetical protein